MVLQPGTGTRHPRPTNRVTVHYTGWTTDGKMFDSSVVRGTPATFGLDEVIKGWTEGVQMMVEGEKRRFWIPESLAYQGASGTLWISGWNDADVSRLMKVDASGEPDEVVEAFDFPLALSAMTFSGNELWGLNEWNQTVVRIDPATAQITGTFAIPDRTVSWRAIAAVGDRLVLVGEGGTSSAPSLLAKRKRSASLAENGRGVILVVQKP